MDRRKFLKVSGGIAGAGVIAGCSGDGGSGGSGSGDGSSGGDGSGGSGSGGSGSGGDSGSGEPIKIGGIEPLSGLFSPWGNAHVKGIDFALDEINSNGGVLGGRKLEFVSEDTKGNPSEADSIFRRMAEQEDIVAATGPVNSDVGVRTAQTAEDLGVPLYLHMAGSDAIITENTEHVYRVGLLQATNIMKSQAQLVADQDIQKVGAIVGDFAWGRSIQEAIKKHFPVDVQIEVAPVGASDFKSQLRKFPKDLDMFIATGHPPGQITITKQLFSLNLNPDLITGSGFPLSVLAGALGDLVTRGVVMYHLNDIKKDAFLDVAKRYAQKTGGEYFGPNISYGYVTMKLIAAGLEKAGEASPAALNEAMKDITFETIYTEPIKYKNNGGLHMAVNNFSRIKLQAPDYASKAKASLNQFFQTEPIPTIPASKN